MRIGTYNIFQFKGYPEEEAGQALGPLDNPARVEHFRRVFEKLDCDILALQEGGAPTHMLHELASSLGRHLATIPSPGKWPGQVLSRYPILESRTFSHFPGTYRFPRSAGAQAPYASNCAMLTACGCLSFICILPMVKYGKWKPTLSANVSSNCSERKTRWSS